MLPEIREVFAALQAYVAAVRQGGMVKVPPWQCPRSAPAPPQGAPDSSCWPGASERPAN